MLTQYAQRIAGQRIRAQADFLAPAVNVANPVGRFKKYTEKNRFRVPNTRRASGGRATEITFTAEDANYNCAYHAIDVPMDKQDIDAHDLESFAMEAMDLGADIQALSHERDVINAALTALGAGTDNNWTSDSFNPIKLIDDTINDLRKVTAGTGEIRIAWGPQAWIRFKHNKFVVDSFKVGRGAGSATAQSITLEAARPLFIFEPQMRVFSMVEDVEPEGKAADLQYLLDDAVIVFATNPNPTRFDASFMKTFRKSGAWMRPRFYERDDSRVEVTALDWSEDVQVTNTVGAVRLNANAS